MSPTDAAVPGKEGEGEGEGVNEQAQSTRGITEGSGEITKELDSTVCAGTAEKHKDRRTCVGGTFRILGQAALSLTDHVDDDLPQDRNDLEALHLDPIPGQDDVVPLASPHCPR